MSDHEVFVITCNSVLITLLNKQNFTPNRLNAHNTVQYIQLNF